MILIMKDFNTDIILFLFTVILAMYIPVAATGYAVLGSAVQSNIMTSLNVDFILTIAIALQIINLLGTFIISFNPVAQAIEDISNVPDSKTSISFLSLVLFVLLLSFAH